MRSWGEGGEGHGGEGKRRKGGEKRVEGSGKAGEERKREEAEGGTIEGRKWVDKRGVMVEELGKREGQPRCNV